MACMTSIRPGLRPAAATGRCSRRCRLERRSRTCRLGILIRAPEQDQSSARQRVDTQ